MEKYYHITEALESTAQSVQFLQTLKVGKWKRTNKFKLHETDVRVFKHEDGTEVTIVTDNSKYHPYSQIFNMNLYYLKDLRDKLKPVFNKYYDLDSIGYIYLNPFTMELMVSCSDGGWLYSDLSKSKIESLIEDNGDMWDAEGNFAIEGVYMEGHDGYKHMDEFEEAKIFSSIEFADEYYPELDEEQYILLDQLESIEL